MNVSYVAGQPLQVTGLENSVLKMHYEYVFVVRLNALELRWAEDDQNTRELWKERDRLRCLASLSKKETL